MNNITNYYIHYIYIIKLKFCSMSFRILIKLFKNYIIENI